MVKGTVADLRSVGVHDSLNSFFVAVVGAMVLVRNRTFLDTCPQALQLPEGSSSEPPVRCVPCCGRDVAPAVVTSGERASAWKWDLMSGARIPIHASKSDIFKGSNAATRRSAPLPPSLSINLHSPGEALESNDRRQFEEQLGHSLAHVRIHADAAADHSAKAIGAAAFTVGQHMSSHPAGSNRARQEVSGCSHTSSSTPFSSATPCTGHRNPRP